MAARNRVGFVVALVVVAAILFVVPTAWLYARGAPWWACTAIGVLIFPILPVGWHLLRERQRRHALAGKPAKASLTGADRFVLRLAVVALVALGPLLLLRPGQTWRAVRHHGLWFVPTPPPAPAHYHGDPRLLAQVPADAELVIWARSLSIQGGKPDPDQPKEMLIAYRRGDALIAVRGAGKSAMKDLDKGLAELNQKVATQTFFPLQGPFAVHKRSGDLVVVVTPGWAQATDDRDAGKGTGNQAIEKRLAAAPPDAIVITASAPAHPVAGMTFVGMHSWLRVTKDLIRVDAEFELADRATSNALVERANAETKELAGMVPADCKKPVTDLLNKIVLDAGDTTVKMSVRWKPQEVGQVMMCAMAVAFDKH